MEKQISETNYVVGVLGRRERSEIYHINLMKLYVQWERVTNIVLEENYEIQVREEELNISYINSEPAKSDFQNIVLNSTPEERCSPVQIGQLAELFGKYKEVFFFDDPVRTDMIVHDTELNSERKLSRA